MIRNITLGYKIKTRLTYLYNLSYNIIFKVDIFYLRKNEGLLKLNKRSLLSVNVLDVILFVCFISFKSFVGNFSCPYVLYGLFYINICLTWKDSFSRWGELYTLNTACLLKHFANCLMYDKRNKILIMALNNSKFFLKYFDFSIVGARYKEPVWSIL